MLNEIDPASGLPLTMIRLAWFLGLTILVFAVMVPCILAAAKRKPAGQDDGTEADL